MTIYALLIGINDYAGNVPDLNGCHNDVDRFSDVLRSRYSVSDDDILMLKSGEATKANIVDGFTSHLAQAQDDDTAIIYYSGHGSQERSPEQFWDIEADRQNETIVCHDSRSGVNGSNPAGDLADKELRFLIAGLAKHNPHIVVIFDCCHSGSGTRSAGSVDSSAVRMAQADRRNRSIQQYVFFDTAEEEGWTEDMRRLPEGQHVFLSGCQDSELSKELVIEGKRHGAFTHYLCKTLETTSSSLSYRNIVSRINQQVQGLVQKQHPQVVGIKDADINEKFMGGDIQPVKLTVTAKNNQWWVDAGAIHGMKVGDELVVFKDVEDDEPIVTTVIETVEPEKSVLAVDAQTDLEKSEAYIASVVHQSKSKLAIQIMGNKQGVDLAREVLENMEGEAEASQFLEENKAKPSYQLIADNDRYTVSLAIDKQPLFMPVEGGYTRDTAKKALRQLEHMAKWQHKLELDNVGSQMDSEPVQLVIRQVTNVTSVINNTNTDGISENKVIEVIDENLELRYSLKQGDWEPPKFGVELRLNPEFDHAQPLYCALLLFNPLDGSVQSVTGNGVWLRSTTVIDSDSGSANTLHAKPVFKIFDGEMIEAFVDDRLYQQGITESRDILKLIVSEAAFNASLLEQEGLDIYDISLDPLAVKSVTRGGNELATMLEAAMDYTNTRGWRRVSKPKLADWTTKSITLTTIRPLDRIIIPDDVAASLGLGVEIEPHPLNAFISLESQTEANRGLTDYNRGHMATPAALQDNTITPPFSLASTRSSEAGLSVIKIDLPVTRDVALTPGGSTAGAESVTPEKPLVISIDTPLKEGEHVLPFAFDGEYYFPLGHAVSANNKTRILIETLPASAIGSGVESGVESAAISRGLGNSLKLYFQKITSDFLKLDKDTVRLAIPEFPATDQSEKKVVFNKDKETIKEQVANADKVLVFIHGIIGETESMIGAVNTPLEDGSCIRDKYDLILCFDYENLNTPIEETARLLKEKLQQVGLKEGHGKQLHLVAHSMGGLVSRWMIEAEGGKKFITKLVMLGTPNNGSPWAGIKTKGVSKVRSWAYSSLTLVLNGLTVVPVGGVAVAGLMKLIDSIDDTLDQMGEDSDFTKELYKQEDPRIPYYLIAGDTNKLSIHVDEEGFSKFFKEALQRCKLAAFDALSLTLFSENNDVAVNNSSMKYIKPDRVPAIEITDVVSDHMSYFVTSESLEALDKAL